MEPDKIGYPQTDRGGMLPKTTSAWLRARFKDEVAQRFRGARADELSVQPPPKQEHVNGFDGDKEAGVGEGAAEGAAAAEGGVEHKASSSPSLLVSFALPVSSYATTFLQHLTGKGLEGWSREGGGDLDELDGSDNDDGDELGEFDGGEEAFLEVGEIGEEMLNDI